MMRRTVKLLVCSALLWSPRPGARALSMNYEFVLCAAAAESFLHSVFLVLFVFFFEARYAPSNLPKVCGWFYFAARQELSAKCS